MRKLLCDRFVAQGREHLSERGSAFAGEEGESRTIRVYRKQRLLEVSIVTIPSNGNALVQRARKLKREDEVEHYRDLAEKVEAMADDPIRWNRSLAARFDVADEELVPSSLVYDWSG